MTAYYNENDPFAAAWLRELIKGGHIAAGDVDERSIKDVRPNDLKDYTQCHFFAGIGTWSHALRQAGWPDDRKVWTGSCPCQSFSAAGKRKGFKDERHLWPIWFPLIKECHPEHIFGEQVASKDALVWLDLVSSDLEGANYAVGAVDTCAAGFGAPHIRQRLYWVADSQQRGRHDWGRLHRRRDQEGEWGETPIGGESRQQVKGDSSAILVAHPNGRLASDRNVQRSGEYGFIAQDGSVSGPVEHSQSEQVGLPGRAREPRSAVGDSEIHRHEGEPLHADGESPFGTPQASFWSACDWLPCIDGKVRPVEPGTFPLAHGAPNRVGRLRGYGNSLVAPQAQAFIETYLEVEREDLQVNHK